MIDVRRFCEILLRRILIAGGISAALMLSFIPFNLWLLQSVGSLPVANQVIANRNFVATLVNQSLQLIGISILVTNLYMMVKLVKAIPSIITKQEFKEQHPSIPEHYLEGVDRANDESVQ